MNTKTRSKTRRRAFPSGYRSIRGVLRANDSWMFAVQAFGVDAESTPRLCKLVALDQLSGNQRKKAERWIRFLDSPHGANGEG